MLVYVLPNLYIRGGAESTGTLPVTLRSPFIQAWPPSGGCQAWSIIDIPHFPTRNALMRQYVVLSGMSIEYCFPQIAFQ